MAEKGVEDVITIRKSLDRLSDIQLKVLSLFSANLRELRLAMEEEDKALRREQEQFLSLIENGYDQDDLQLEGRYRGLLQMLDYIRNDQEALQVERVRTTRNETIPARISISLSVSAKFNEYGQNENENFEY